MAPDRAIATILRQQSLDHAWAVLTTTFETYGFDRLIYGRTNFLKGHYFGEDRDHVLLAKHDQEYVRQYITNKVFRFGPFFFWSLKNNGFISWSHADNLDLPAEAIAMAMKGTEINLRYDVTAGYTASFPNARPTQKSVASICARRGISQGEVDNIWTENRDTLEGCLLAFDLKCATLPYLEHNNLLTPKQREVLGWVAEGKSIDDIAVIMQLSRSTIEKHLANSRARLGVTANAQAVAKLIFLNQLHFDSID